MSDDARDLIRSIRTDQQLAIFGARLRSWILTEMKSGEGDDVDYPESRARALLRSSGAIDDVTLKDFSRLVTGSAGMRVALYDLLASSDLAPNEEVQALAAVAGRTPAGETPDIGWLSLAICGHAWKRGYPVNQLDPAYPPQRFSPAGQVLANAAAFIRQQIQRGATERDRLAQILAPRESNASLEQLTAQGTIAPLPPHFRPPIPVRYPEVARETLRVEPDDQATHQPASREAPLTITEADLQNEAGQSEQRAVEPGAPLRMPPIRISRDQVPPPQPPSPLPPSAVVMPASSSDSRPGLTVALRQMFGSDSLATTKLRVVAQEYPDGPGLYGLQVKVSCKGIRSFVAGTTDRNGRFVAELPVKVQEGLTYDVDLTWPREMGGEVERKSMTLHADRTEFVLPFYRRLDTSHSESNDEAAGG